MKSTDAFGRKRRLVAKNRRAYHDYHIIQSIEAGIALQGTEVKSIRNNKCSLQDAYAAFNNPKSDELYLINFHISPYDQGNRENHEPKRTRKLLLNHREAIKLKKAVQERGFTLIPLSVYFSGPFVKIELGLVKSKRQYDKRQATKKRELDRELRRKYRFK